MKASRHWQLASLSTSYSFLTFLYWHQLLWRWRNGRRTSTSLSTLQQTTKGRLQIESMSMSQRWSTDRKNIIKCSKILPVCGENIGRCLQQLRPILQNVIKFDQCVENRCLCTTATSPTPTWLSSDSSITSTSGRESCPSAFPRWA